MSDEIGDVQIARHDVRVSGVLVEIALRLVERDLRQLPGIDRLDELDAVDAAVAQMLGAGRRARREVGEIVERLVVKLKRRRRGAIA